MKGVILLWTAAALVTGQGTEVGDPQSQINTLVAQKSEMAFALLPNMTQWQYLLLPTPTVVKLLGQAVVLSSKVDVSLEDQAPRGGWKHARYPGSLRASLLQVANDGWDAFHVAHKNMDHISLTMLVVPKHIRTALMVIKTVKYEDLSKFLRIPLNSIEKAGDRCVELAVETQDAFVEVMGLTAELSTAVAGSQVTVIRDLLGLCDAKRGNVNKAVTAKFEGKHDVLIVEAEAQLEAAKTQKALMDEQKKFMLDRYEEQKKVVNDARHAYEKAIKKIPTGFKAFAMDLFKSIAPALVGGFMGVPVFGGGKSGGGAGQGGVGGAQAANVSKDLHDPVILQTMRMVSDRVPEMRSYILQALGDAGDAGAEEIKNFFTTMRAIFEETAARFQNYPNTALKVIAKKSLATLLKISEGLEQKMTELASDVTEEARAEILAKVDEVQADLEELVAAGIVSGDTMGTQLPQRQGRGGTGSSVGANERFIAQSRLSNLENAEDRLESVFRDINEFNQQLTEVEVRLTQIDLRKVNLEQVRELLRQVLSILGRIRELWARLVQFFTIIANRAKILNTDFLGPFLDMTELAGNTIDGNGDEERNAMVQLLREQALDITTVSHLLHVMAKTYVRVSETQVLGKLAGLARLLAARDDDERNLWFAELDTDATEARANILAIIAATKEKYSRDILAKRHLLQSAIAAMGGVTAEEEEHIQAGVQLANDLNSGGNGIVPDEPVDPWDMTDVLGL